MPSLQLTGAVSGGIPIVSGVVFSGNTLLFPTGGINLRYSSSGIGPIYVGLPNPLGTPLTILSGGSLTSGGLGDGFEMIPGQNLFIYKSRLTSGLESIRLGVPAAGSGGRLFWDIDTRDA